MAEGDNRFMRNISKFKKLYYLISTKFLGNFRKVGNKAVVFCPMQIDNPEGISLGNHCFIHHNSWLMGTAEQEEKGLMIGENTVIGHFAHIIAWKNVKIGNNVLIADRVFISDCTHQYKNIITPIINQDIKVLKPVIIGDDSWIGENVCICGANIGKHCVVGANSVVTKDIPDYCIAVGNPARIIKRYDFEMGDWI